MLLEQEKILKFLLTPEPGWNLAEPIISSFRLMLGKA